MVVVVEEDDGLVVVVEEDDGLVVTVVEVVVPPVISAKISSQAVRTLVTATSAKINASNLSILLFFMVNSSLFYFFPVFLGGAFRLIIAVGIILFVFKIVGQIMLLDVMVFIIVGVFISLKQR